MTDKFRQPTVKQAEKMVITIAEGKKKGQTDTRATVNEILKKAYPHSLSYTDVLAIIDRGGGTIKGDDSNPKTARVRRIRWCMYKMARQGLAVKVLGEPNQPVQWCLTEEGFEEVGDDS